MKTYFALLLCTWLSFGQARVPGPGGTPASSGGTPIVHQAANCTSAALTLPGTNTPTFTCTPATANNAIVFMVECTPSIGTVTAISMAASGWTFTALTAVTAEAGSFGATFGALANTNTSTTFAVTFTGVANCSTAFTHMNDEWSNNDTTGGTTTFYAHNVNATASGGCSGAASTSASANDAVWAACSDNLPTSAWSGSGWTIGVNDANGDGTEYKIATGSQTPVWASGSGASIAFSVAVKAH